MEIAITKISSKGQIVIPLEMRRNLEEGEKLIVIKNNDQLILKPAGSLGKNFEEDLAFAKKTEKAWDQISSGKCTEMEFDDFLDELEK
jgi:AbrB family looped-hinge helix DNA binding protein